ncbi:MAG: sugar transferase [Myxococcaceae bacterium]
MKVLSRIAPRSASRANLLWDLAAVVIAVVFFGRGAAASNFASPLIAVALWAFGSFALRFYDPWAKRLAIDDAAMLSLMVAGELLLAALMNELVPAFGLSHLAKFAAALWALVVLPRVLVFRGLARREQPLDEVLIVGTGPLARHTGEDIETLRHPRRRVIGYVRLQDEVAPESIRQRVIGNSTELARILELHPVNEVFIATNAPRHVREVQSAVETCERYGMPFAVPAFHCRFTRARPADPQATHDGYLHFVHVRSNPYEEALKRLFDMIVSTAALVLLSPLLLTVALLVKLTSRGPIFFKQQRIGLHGRPFNMLKFRSMVVNADAMKDQLAAMNEQRGPVFKMKNDPRVTAVGRFIRKYSIDELPQIINVLRGEMSIVGPRPPVPKEVVQYEPWQRRRLSVRPGLTCIWQVSGRNQITFDEWMKMDMQYIDHWSLGRDLSLVLQTVPVVVTGRGAS